MPDTVLNFASSETAQRNPYRWYVFAVMLAGEVMDVLDSTIVNVAGPSLKAELHATPVDLQWTIGGYTLAMGAALIIGGRLGDMFGRRRMFLFAMAGFALTSLICATAPTAATLIMARFIQGIAGALLLPQGFALLKDVFAADELPKALSIFGPVMGAAAIAGPVIGGGIIQADILGLGWRAVFGLNVPICLAAFVVAWRVLPRLQKAALQKGMDIIGAVLMAAASGFLVLTLVNGQAAGWVGKNWLYLSLSVIGAAAFVFWQRLRAVKRLPALVEPSLFAKPSFSAGIVGMALFFSAFIGTQLVFTLFLQLGHGFSAGQAGLAGVPFAIASFIGSGLAGALLLEKLGRSVLQFGAVLQLGAIIWLVLALSAVPFSFRQIMPALVLMGTGEGLIVASLISIVISAAEDHEVGSGSGLLAAVQAIASAAGIAAFGGLFFSFLDQGNPSLGYQRALEFQAIMVVLFIAVSFCLPAKTQLNKEA